MFQLSRPTQDSVHDLLAASAQEPMPACSFGSFEAPAAGFRAAVSEFQVGNGVADYESAVEALLTWKHYSLSWIAVFPNPPAVEVGSTFAVAAWTYGAWSVNACRVCECIDDSAPHRRFGFTYRTLSRHVELGDARFTIEHRPDDTVWFCVRTVSRMNHPLTKLFWPFGVRAQKRAVADAARAIQAAVRASRRMSLETPRASLSAADSPRR